MEERDEREDKAERRTAPVVPPFFPHLSRSLSLSLSLASFFLCFLTNCAPQRDTQYTHTHTHTYTHTHTHTYILCTQSTRPPSSTFLSSIPFVAHPNLIHPILSCPHTHTHTHTHPPISPTHPRLALGSPVSSPAFISHPPGQHQGPARPRVLPEAVQAGRGPRPQAAHGHLLHLWQAGVSPLPLVFPPALSFSLVLLDS